MSARFKPFNRLGRQVLHLQLLGEFDGSAACELIKKIEENGSGASQVIVDTTRLRSVHPFGKTVFQSRMSQLSAELAGLTFIGKYKHQFEF